VLCAHRLQKDLTGDARVRAESELAQLKRSQEAAKLAERERKLAVRYHKVVASALRVK
jgi:hypothetical protein